MARKKVDTLEPEASSVDVTKPIPEAVNPVPQSDEPVAVNPVNIGEILKSVDIGALIAAQVQEQVAAAIGNKSNPIVDATHREQKVIQPERYLKHYRCDVSPDLKIQRRAVEGDKLGTVMKGKWISFRRGHFFATEQSEVDQIEWMRQHPAFDPTDNTQTRGGNPTIYEDDGRDLAACAYCGEPFVVGSNAFKAHLRATHGVAID